MAFHRTYVRYGIAPYVIELAMWFVETIGTNSDWFARNVQPWLEPIVWPYGPVFLSGFLVQDLANRHSWLRNIWRRMTARFEITGVFVNASLMDDRITATAHLKFVRKVKSGDLILRVLSLAGTKHLHEHVIKIEKLSKVVRGETRVIQIAVRAIPSPGWTPFHSTWGPGHHSGFFDAGPSLIAGSRNIAIIELDGVWPPQRHQIFLANPQYGSAKDYPHLIALDEDDDIFDEKDRSK